MALQAYVDSHPDSPKLHMPTCLALAFPPTPLLQPCPPQHLPRANLGLPVGLQPTVSLTLPQGTDNQARASQGLELSDAGRVLQERGLKFAQQALHSQYAQQSQQAQQVQSQTKPKQTVFSSAKQPVNSKPGAATRQQSIPDHASQGRASQPAATGAVAANGPMALRFFLSAQLQQTPDGPTWICYLLKCTCTAGGVLKQVSHCHVTLFEIPMFL